MRDGRRQDSPTDEVGEASLLIGGCQDSPFQTRLEAEASYLSRVVFQGLTALRAESKYPSITYFKRADFLQVIERCTALGIQICGIEVFSPDMRFLGCDLANEDSNSWCINSVPWSDDGDALYSATYRIPSRLLG